MKRPTKKSDMDKVDVIEEAIDIMIQGAGKVSAALLGMINRAGGQIYALLFISEEPLSLDEIAARLGISKSNVSVNIRMLEDYKLVRKVWVRGSRKDYYEAERVYPKKVLSDFLARIQGTLSDAITTIERTRAKATEAKVTSSGEKKKRAEFILDQLNILGLFYYSAHQFFEDFFNGKLVDVELLRRVILNPEDFSPKSHKQ